MKRSLGSSPLHFTLWLRQGNRNGTSTSFRARLRNATGTRPLNRLSRSVDATAQRGAPEVAADSHFALAHLGCGQGFQQVLHPAQATDITNDTEQLVATVEAAN